MKDHPRIKLEDLAQRYPGVFDSAQYVGVGTGWLPLVEEFLQAALRQAPDLLVLEIKEKFGEMRIWCDTDNRDARLEKRKAEIKSAFTCEVCGSEGYVRRPPPEGGWSWWKCLCDDHASDVQKTWPKKSGRLADMTQTDGQWYRYDQQSDAMVPCDPPEGVPTKDVSR